MLSFALALPCLLEGVLQEFFLYAASVTAYFKHFCKQTVSMSARMLCEILGPDLRGL